LTTVVFGGDAEAAAALATAAGAGAAPLAVAAQEIRPLFLVLPLVMLLLQLLLPPQQPPVGAAAYLPVCVHQVLLEDV
jgi:hypothetical protein